VAGNLCRCGVYLGVFKACEIAKGGARHA